MVDGACRTESLISRKLLPSVFRNSTVFIRHYSLCGERTLPMLQSLSSWLRIGLHSYDDMQDGVEESVRSKHVIPAPPCPSAIGLRVLGVCRGSFSVSGARGSDDAGGSISEKSPRAFHHNHFEAVVCVSDSKQPVMRMTKAVYAIDVLIHPRTRIIARAKMRGEEDSVS
jgi:hypothetical protein